MTSVSAVARRKSLRGKKFTLPPDLASQKKSAKSKAKDVPEKIKKVVAKKPPQKVKGITKNFNGREDEIEDLINSIETDEVEKRKSPTINNRIFRSRKSLFSKNNRLSKVYDFSQEKTIEDHDPTKDIVKELIREGKVRVATCIKGKGKTKLKRNPAKNKNERKAAPKPPTPQAPRQAPVPVSNNNSIHQYDDVPEDDFQDNDNDISANSCGPIMDNSLPRLPINTTVNDGSNSKDKTMLHHAEKVYSHKKVNQRHLRSVVSKIVNTPNRSGSEASLAPEAASTTLGYNFSAINLPGSTPYRESMSSASPWRSEKNNNLPAVFNFSYNRSNLPSFSSDHLAAEENDEIAKVNATITNQSTTSNSTNDSNAENIIPPEVELQLKNSENLLNLRQQANPLQGRAHRSPLKAINIIENILLPPWKPMKPLEEEKSKTQMESLDLTAVDKSLPLDNCINNSTVSSHNESTSSLTKNKQDLFGFDEYIDDNNDDDDDNQTINSINNSSTISNKTFCEKLRQLRKYRPKIVEKPKDPTMKSQKSSHPNLFGKIDNSGMKQRLLNEMLCSTMINAKDNARRESANLFRDNPVENSFDDNAAHRTYIRPYKRKRKLRQNLVMYLDSDESGEEEGAEPEKQDLHKRKYQRKDQPVATELNQFVEEFNSMCNEVERFELAVEKEV